MLKNALLSLGGKKSVEDDAKYCSSCGKSKLDSDSRMNLEIKLKNKIKFSATGK